MSEPIAFAAQWRAVVYAADHRCQCPGGCGRPHAKRDTSCAARHDRPADTGAWPTRLIAAPADPTVPAARAAAVPVNELLAWCAPCHDATRRAALKRARAEANPDQGRLFS